MTDWKGNKIQAGHTVLIVDVKTMFSGCDVVAFSFGRGEVARFKGQRDYKWSVSQRIIVTECSNDMMISFNDKPSEIPVNHAGFFISKQPHQIICIEGISDSQEEYYTEYFKSC